MNFPAVSIALVASFAGAASLYLSSPHQKWLRTRRSLPAVPSRVAGSLLLVVGLVAFTRAMQIVPAVFAFATWLMLLLPLFPYVGAVIGSPRARG